MAPSLLLNSPTPQVPATGTWGSLYADQEPVKLRHVRITPAAATNKKPAAYGARKKNLETCTEALGCETGGVDDGAADAECPDRKRRFREEEDVEEEMVMAEERTRWSGRRSSCGPLPPPLTTLGRGAGRVRMVRERRDDGRLAVYAVGTPVVEPERSSGRLRMRLLPLPLPCSDGNAAAACCRHESRAAEPEAKKKETVEARKEECSVAKYVRGGRCVEPVVRPAAAAARRIKKWVPEHVVPASFWVATS